MGLDRPFSGGGSNCKALSCTHIVVPQRWLSVDDVDSSLVFMYTPVLEEGAKGEPQCK